MNVKNAVNLVLPICVYTAKLNKTMRIRKMSNEELVKEIFESTGLSLNDFKEKHTLPNFLEDKLNEFPAQEYMSINNKIFCLLLILDRYKLLRCNDEGISILKEEKDLI